MYIIMTGVIALNLLDLQVCSNFDFLVHYCGIHIGLGIFFPKEEFFNGYNYCVFLYLKKLQNGPGPSLYFCKTWHP